MTVAATKSMQPGCSGTIEDGYCTVCGMAAAPAPAPAAQAAPAAPATCTQPGCGGTCCAGGGIPPGAPNGTGGSPPGGPVGACAGMAGIPGPGGAIGSP